MSIEKAVEGYRKKYKKNPRKLRAIDGVLATTKNPHDDRLLSEIRQVTKPKRKPRGQSRGGSGR
jgi:hypothetical protein